MSAFGRGRGILPSKQAPPPPPLLNVVKNGFSTNHTNGQSVGTPSTLPVSPAFNNSPSPSEEPNLHNFGQVLLSLKEEDSLFPIITDIINSPTCTDKVVKRMIEIIIDRCMWLPVISRKFAALLPFLTSHKVFGKEIRRCAFNSLQEIYEDRSSLKKYGENAFRNAVTLTGEVYYRYRIEGSGYKILGVALLNYLQTLAESVHEDDLLTIVQQFSWNGKGMAEIDKDGVQRLMLTVRRNLTVNSPSYTETGRWYLLLCLELQFQQFDCLSEDIVTLYCQSISKKVFSSINPPPAEQDNHLQYYNSIRKFFA